METLGYHICGVLMPRKKGVAKEAVLIRITPEAKRLLERLAAGQGMPLNVCVETLVRAEARRRGVRADDEQ